MAKYRLKASPSVYGTRRLYAIEKRSWLWLGLWREQHRVWLEDEVEDKVAQECIDRWLAREKEAARKNNQIINYRPLN